MARNDPSPSDENHPSGEQNSQPSGPRPFLARFLTGRWLLTLLALSVAGHALSLAYFRLRPQAAADDLSPEVSLGEFCFTADPTEDGPIAAATFSVHIALLGQVESTARRELRAKRFRVQQAIEELVRRAHAGDFEDPALASLKQQIQEQVNGVVGTRVIADVIITGLRLARRNRLLDASTPTTNTPPWTEDLGPGTRDVVVCPD